MKAITILFITFGLCQGYVSSPRLAYFLPDENIKQCQGPEGAGLEYSLADFDKFAPFRKIYRLVLAALASDQEVKNVFSYMGSSEATERFNRFLKSVEVVEIINFACKDLYFDAMYRVEQFISMLGLPPLEPNPIIPPLESNSIPGVIRQGGLRGLFANILRVVDMENLKVYLQDKIDNDEYVQLIYKGLNTPEGWEVYQKMINNEDIQKYFEDIAQLVADPIAALEYFDKLFEWLEVFYA